MEFFTKKAFEAKGGSLCAYLVALAAFQAGLRVTFIRDPNLIQGLRVALHDYQGDVFTLTDGANEYYFHRTMGSLTSASSRKIIGNKNTTKEILKSRSVPCPDGMVVDAATALQDRMLFSKLGFRKVVCKPITGSFGRGVYTGIETQDQLTRALANQQNTVQQVVIEQHLDGVENRYFVANGKVVAVTGRQRANIVGDGISSISQLIEKKNNHRRNNPHLASRLIEKSSSAQVEIERQGFSSLEDVPDFGQQVHVSGVANLSAGGDSSDETERVSDSSKKVAIAAAAALEVPNCGVDMISVSDSNGQSHYVIEVNARAQIGSHSFPMLGTGQGNKVAQEIVSAYFPGVSTHLPHVFFSFLAVQRALRDQWVSSVSLPCLADRDTHELLIDTFVVSDRDIAEAFREMFLLSGALGDVRRLDRSTLSVRVIGTTTQYGAFIARLFERNGNDYRLRKERRTFEPFDGAVKIFESEYDGCFEVRYDRSCRRAAADIKVGTWAVLRKTWNSSGAKALRKLIARSF